ncbi:MAG: nitrate reductase [Porticoccaceae bacterium]|nr:nitrate reductase [Porticoccaceae bacterium]
MSEQQSPIRKTTCPYCGVGCGVDATISPEGDDADNRVAVSGSSEHPANLGRLCVKGSALHETLGNRGRLLYPKVRGQRVDWDTALDTVAAGFKAVADQHGPQSVAFYLSGQLLTEDYYVANKLMKGFIGSANVDTNSRLCMASAVAGYKRAFGADAVPCSYEDLEQCDLLVMVGSNAAWTHPVLYQRIVAAKKANPALRVVVIDPRATATCDVADLHLPVRPGADTFIFVGLLNYLAQHDKLNRDYIDAHTNGMDNALAVSGGFGLANVAALSDISERALETFYLWFARTEKTVSFYSQGVNQSSSGTDKCNAIINCHLATGRIGKPGAGPFSITGQPNAMGGREVGGLANQLAAHMDFTPEDIERVARFWDAPNMATAGGLKAVDLFDAIDRGEVKAVWIMATNPVVSLPDADTVRRALAKCELVVVSDCIESTDTNVYADILLPATGWGEKDGTVTNSERRISRQRPLQQPAGEARHDWWIVSRVAQKMGFERAFDYQSPRDVFVEHAALSGYENNGSRAFDISGLESLSESGYENLEPVQWPVNAANPRGSERLFADGRFFTADGRASLVPVVPSLPAKKTDRDHPFLLNTGRIRDQWHTMTRTARAPRLLSHIEAPFIAMNPMDADRLGICDGDLVAVTNNLGEIHLEAQLDTGMRPGDLFAPMHWNAQFASRAGVASLISSDRDPHSGQPESKYIPVAITGMAVRNWIQVVSPEELTLTGVDYWLKVPVEGGYSYRLALFETSETSVETLMKTWREEVLGDCQAIEYQDPVNNTYRCLARRDDALRLMVFSAPTRHLLPDSDWLRAQPGRSLPESPWTLLAGRDAEGESKGRLVCSCFEVGEHQIGRAIANGCETVKALGETLGCGTNCGSCIPELKNLLRTLGDDARSDAA